MSRVPIRIRLTLAFAFAMAAVLAATGAFLTLRLGAALDDQIQQTLQTKAADVTSLIAQSDNGLHVVGGPRLASQGDSFAQVIGPAGTVVNSSPGLAPTPLLSPADLQRARGGAILRTIPNTSEGDGLSRVFAMPVAVKSKAERFVTSRLVPSAKWAVTRMRKWSAGSTRILFAGVTSSFVSRAAFGGSGGHPAAIHVLRMSYSGLSFENRTPPS